MAHARPDRALIVDQPDRDNEPEDQSGRGPRRSVVADALAKGADRRRQDRGIHDEPAD